MNSIKTNIFEGKKITRENAWHLETILKNVSDNYQNCSISQDGFIVKAESKWFCINKKKARIDDLLREQLIDEVINFKTHGLEEKMPNIRKAFGKMVKSELLPSLIKGDINRAIEQLYVHYLRKDSPKMIAYNQETGMAIALEGNTLIGEKSLGESISELAQGLNAGIFRVASQQKEEEDAYLSYLMGTNE